MATIGSNLFFNVLVPLAYESRYFVLERDNPAIMSVLNQTVIGPAEWEIRRNEPGESSVSAVAKTPAGLVTVTDRATGRFLYKLRPGSETSIVFGKLDGGTLECVIRDNCITVGTNTFSKNRIYNAAVGLHIDARGGIAIGGSRVPQPVLDAYRAAA